MKKIMIALIVLLVSQLFQSCHKINGEGATVTQTYSPGSFTAIDAAIDADVYYTVGSSCKVEIQAQQNILNIIQMQVVGNELQLQFEKYKNVRHHDRIIVNITAPSLTGLGINGSGDMRVLQAVEVNNLALKVNGSGSINIAQVNGSSIAASISGSGSISVNGGAVNNESLHISGSGNIDLQQVMAKYVATKTSGSGKTSVYVTDNLDVEISGSGDVYYLGNPSVHSYISGSGNVTHM